MSGEQQLQKLAPELEAMLQMRRPPEVMQHLFGTLLMLTSPEHAEEEMGDYSWKALLQWIGQCGGAAAFLANLNKFSPAGRLRVVKAQHALQRIRQLKLYPHHLADKLHGGLLASVSRWMLRVCHTALQSADHESFASDVVIGENRMRSEGLRSAHRKQKKERSCIAKQLAKKMKVEGWSTVEVERQLEEARAIAAVCWKHGREVKAVIAERTAECLEEALVFMMDLSAPSKEHKDRFSHVMPRVNTHRAPVRPSRHRPMSAAATRSERTSVNVTIGAQAPNPRSVAVPSMQSVSGRSTVESSELRAQIVGLRSRITSSTEATPSRELQPFWRPRPVGANVNVGKQAAENLPEPHEDTNSPQVDSEPAVSEQAPSEQEGENRKVPNKSKYAKPSNQVHQISG